MRMNKKRKRCRERKKMGEVTSFQEERGVIDLLYGREGEKKEGWNGKGGRKGGSEPH